MSFVDASVQTQHELICYIYQLSVGERLDENIYMYPNEKCVFL